jgi:ketosteroid isomerase-like protein
MKHFINKATILVATLVIIVMYSFKATSTNKKNIEIKYKNSIVSYYGSKTVTEKELLKNAKLIDIADRRFETKWQNKDAKGISEEYTTKDAVFMKPGKKPRLGRKEIEKEFSESVKSVDRVEFFQDELEFFGDMDVAFQRCHMLGYVNSKTEHVFEGSYVILWKKEQNNWLIEYDMFNSDN